VIEKKKDNLPVRLDLQCVPDYEMQQEEAKDSSPDAAPNHPAETG